MTATARPAIDEDDLVPISALQHQLFCPRQCALIHLEQQWLEDGATAEGRILHEPDGTGGFGYDPLFWSSDLQLTLARATDKVKNRVSHRARATATFLRVRPAFR